jgi:hypothetical protein
MERRFPVELTPAAEDVILRAEGAAPPSVETKVCPECAARGEVFMQVHASDYGHVLHVVAPCEHILDTIHGGSAYLVWGGRRGYSVLTLDAALLMGWRFAQDEPGTIYLLGQHDCQIIGILLASEGEWLELTSPCHVQCGQQPALSGNTLEFLRQRLRVASTGSDVAVFKPLNVLADYE